MAKINNLTKVYIPKLREVADSLDKSQLTDAEAETARDLIVKLYALFDRASKRPPSK